MQGVAWECEQLRGAKCNMPSHCCERDPIAEALVFYRVCVYICIHLIGQINQQKTSFCNAFLELCVCN